MYLFLKNIQLFLCLSRRSVYVNCGPWTVSDERDVKIMVRDDRMIVFLCGMLELHAFKCL